MEINPLELRPREAIPRFFLVGIRFRNFGIFSNVALLVASRPLIHFHPLYNLFWAPILRRVPFRSFPLLSIPLSPPLYLLRPLCGPILYYDLYLCHQQSSVPDGISVDHEIDFGDAECSDPTIHRVLTYRHLSLMDRLRQLSLSRILYYYDVLSPVPFPFPCYILSMKYQATVEMRRIILCV